MNRQSVIRGAAVSIAAIAASFLLAGQFLGDKDVLTVGSLANSPTEVRGASIVGPYGTTSVPANAEHDLTFSALDSSPERDAALPPQDSFQPELSFAEQAMPVEQSLCDAVFTASPAIDGLIELRLSAPCNARDRVVISHGDLAFSAMLDAAGGYSGYIPALAADARIDAFLSDDTYLQAQTSVADHANYARMIVQWSGAAKVELHAYHRGAAHGDAGHIHALNPFDPALEEAFLVALGDDTGLEPMQAQVYSVPVAASGATRLKLEALLNADSCGADLVAFIMPTHGAGAGIVEELRVAMPDCGLGDGLVIVDLPFNPLAPVAGELEFTSDQS